MSAILTSPSLPTMQNLEDLKSYIQSEIQKGIEKALSPENYVSIEDYNELKSSYIDTVGLLANAMKRITQLEDALFLHDSEGELVKNDYDKPVLSQNITTISEKPIEEKKDENPIIANTTLTKKASALTEYLEKKTKANWSGKIVLENQDIYTFFKEIIQEDLRWPERMKGYRGAKKLIIERAQELFPHKVEVVRNKSGNKITGLALKPSVKRTDTYGC
jgi:hypothetical protein